MTLTELLRDCSRGCIIVSARIPCPFCSESCSGLHMLMISRGIHNPPGFPADIGTDECHPANESSCGTNQICLAVGVAGRYTCVNRKCSYMCSLHVAVCESYMSWSRQGQTWEGSSNVVSCYHWFSVTLVLAMVRSITICIFNWAHVLCLPVTYLPASQDQFAW